LEEYNAELNQMAAEAVQLKTRKPGEGDDAKINQQLVPLKQPEKTIKDEEQDERKSNHIFHAYLTFFFDQMRLKPNFERTTYSK
jgi:hypothetical protein